MSASVPLRRVDVSHDGALAAKAVEGRTPASMNRQVSWLLGGGGQAVPAYSPEVTLSAGTDYIFKFISNRRVQALQRLWSVIAEGDTEVNIRAKHGGAVSRFAADFDAPNELQVKESVTSQSGGKESHDLVIEPLDADVFIASIACEEIPRARLAPDSTDLGTDVSALRPGQPDTIDAVKRLFERMEGSETPGERNSLVNWAVPYATNLSSPTVTTAFAANTTSGSFQLVFPIGLPILGRMGKRGTTTRSVDCYALAWVDSGEAELLFTSSGGVVTSATQTISATSPTEVGPVQLDVDSEDLSTSDGLRLGWDVFNCNIRVTTATTIYVATVAAFETP